MANHNRSERLPGEVLAPADIRALLRACNQGPTGARNCAQRGSLASVFFHRVGAQDALSLSPQILRSGRLLPLRLGGLELRPPARGSARAAAEGRGW